MTFNAGQYMKAVSEQQQASGSLQQGLSQSENKKTKGQEFVLDEQDRYAEVQEKAGTIFSGIKQKLGLAGTLFALAVGAPMVAAAIIGGGTAYLGGKYAKGKAKDKLDESKFFKGQTADAMTAMDKQIMKDTIYGAVSAGGGAHLRDAAKAKELATAGEGAASTVSTGPTSFVDAEKYSTLEAFEASGTEASSVNPYAGKDPYSSIAPKDAYGNAYEGLGLKMYEGGQNIGQKLFGNKYAKNLGYTAQGVWDFGGSQLSKGFDRSKSLLDYAYAGAAVKGAMK